MSKYKDTDLTLLNFRDLGGLETNDGRIIKRGRIFRTSTFTPQTSKDLEFLSSMNLDTIIDLRSLDEIEEKPNTYLGSATYIKAPAFSIEKFAPLAPTKKQANSIFFMKPSEVEDLFNLMFESYAFLPYSVSSYSYLFESMEENKNFAFHCTAGKDRTGVAAMLIELTLGRNYDQALEQYLLSNETRKEWIANMRKKVSYLPVSKKKKDFAYYAMGVTKELFDKAYNAIFDKYQTIEDFLFDVYGITKDQIDKWKNNYLE